MVSWPKPLMFIPPKLPELLNDDDKLSVWLPDSTPPNPLIDGDAVDDEVDT